MNIKNITNFKFFENFQKQMLHTQLVEKLVENFNQRYLFLFCIAIGMMLITNEYSGGWYSFLISIQKIEIHHTVRLLNNFES